MGDGTEEEMEICSTDDGSLAFLDNIAQDFSSEEPMGSEVNDNIASIVNSSFTKRLGENKMKAVLDLYNRHKNCGNLNSVKVNAESWDKMKPHTRFRDVKMQKMRAKLVKGATAMVTAVDKAKATSKGKSAQNMIPDIKAGLETMIMVGAVYQDIHIHRM